MVHAGVRPRAGLSVHGRGKWGISPQRRRGTEKQRSREKRRSGDEKRKRRLERKRRKNETGKECGVVTTAKREC